MRQIVQKYREESSSFSAYLNRSSRVNSEMNNFHENTAKKLSPIKYFIKTDILCYLYELDFYASA